jgi:hypothetical protein
MVLSNTEARRVTRITLALAIPMMFTGILISDSGHHPAAVWGILEIIGVVLAVLSLPFQSYEWYVRLAPWLKRDQSGSQTEDRS